MRIRLLKKTDIDICSYLFFKTFSKEKKNKRWSITCINKYISMIYRLSKDMCFVAVENNKIIGVSLNLIIPKYSNNFLKIIMLIVDDKYRKKKIATTLIKKVIQKADKKYKIEKTELEVENTTNFPIMWFEKIGFSRKKNYELLSGRIKEIEEGL